MNYEQLKAKLTGAAYSKLVWYGFAIAVLGYLESQRSALDPLIPERYRPVIWPAIGLGVVVLRFVTSLPLEAKGHKAKPE